MDSVEWAEKASWTLAFQINVLKHPFQQSIRKTVLKNLDMWYLLINGFFNEYYGIAQEQYLSPGTVEVFSIPWF